jgi:outer membrane protein OmpA-like peptidoglycan-associated protein
MSISPYQKGINSDRLIDSGYGKSKLIAPNSLPNGADNPERGQLTRRTELAILNK